ncbi:hypothetical protein BZA05DRAFT_425094 [Tricharina praecox]|uniref:uncharacterized protein n=1 Tax=Tricharina praecox TaxID=43433 RepID=UPI00221E6991|nr:uncharacterized protein BZA05DRAFT_425094 [Tricharina praecox]KAI5854429.1 hypothetical protein BZA05DRAFT_425094 [Tricharina praecox]
MTDGSPDRRKRSKWDDAPRDPRLDRDRDQHSHRGGGEDGGDRERSSGRSRWDDRRGETGHGHRERERERDHPREDRRSRSPASSSRRRSKSPTTVTARSINAQIQAKRGVQHVDVPPIRSSIGKSSSPPATNTFSSEMYIADGDYIKDIEVNDLRNRYTLTKGATQKMIKEETGADVTTRGAYYPDKSMATPANPPLYLHITSTTKEGLEKAVAKIEDLMKQELPNLVDERRFRRREPPEPVERDEYGRRKWPEERIPVGLEPIPGFNLRASVVGHGGQYVKHIQQETRCRVQIKGRGSGFREHGTEESDDPLYLHVTGPDPGEVQRAKELCEDLVGSVRLQYEEHKSQPQPTRFPGYGAGGGGGGGGGGSGYVPNQQQQQPTGGSPPPPPPPPTGPSSAAPPPPPPSASPTGVDPAAAAAAYNPYAAYYANAGGVDPYAAYGGYAAYMQYCECSSHTKHTTRKPSSPARPAPPQAPLPDLPEPSMASAGHPECEYH